MNLRKARESFVEPMPGPRFVVRHFMRAATVDPFQRTDHPRLPAGLAPEPTQPVARGVLVRSNEAAVVVSVEGCCRRVPEPPAYPWNVGRQETVMSPARFFGVDGLLAWTAFLPGHRRDSLQQPRSLSKLRAAQVGQSLARARALLGVRFVRSATA